MARLQNPFRSDGFEEAELVVKSSIDRQESNQFRGGYTASALCARLQCCRETFRCQINREIQFCFSCFSAFLIGSCFLHDLRSLHSESVLMLSSSSLESCSTIFRVRSMLFAFNLLDIFSASLTLSLGPEISSTDIEQSI